jgi:hypothetical protein
LQAIRFWPGHAARCRDRTIALWWRALQSIYMKSLYLLYLIIYKYLNRAGINNPAVVAQNLQSPLFGLHRCLQPPMALLVSMM